jgi:hypothetical protein
LGAAPTKAPRDVNMMSTVAHAMTLILTFVEVDEGFLIDATSTIETMEVVARLHAWPAFLAVSKNY